METAQHCDRFLTGNVMPYADCTQEPETAHVLRHDTTEDQARAVQNLPTDPEWLHIGCTSGVSEGHSQSTEDTGCHSEAAGSGDTSPCDVSPSGTRRQKKHRQSLTVPKWRRRESNPRPVIAPRKLLRV